MAAISTNAVVAAILSGVEAAQIDYSRMSGGEWVWTASEYVLTTYIAKAIDGVKGSKYITVEHSGASAIQDADAVVPGPKPLKARLRGRFDLLLWWADARPRAVIEVKNQLGGPSGWFHDIERLRDVLWIARGRSSLKFGAFAYYYSAADGARFSAGEKVLRKFKSVEDHINRKAGTKLHVRQFTSNVHQEEDGAWVAACVLLKAKA